MTKPLPTIQHGDLYADLDQRPTVLLAGSGGWLTFEVWLWEHGAVFGWGAEFPRAVLANVTVSDYSQIFKDLPAGRPAIVYLPGEDDMRFYADAKFDELWLGSRGATVLRERRSLSFWSELPVNPDPDDDGNDLDEGEPWASGEMTGRSRAAAPEEARA